MEDFGYGMEENCQYGTWKNRLPFHTNIMPCRQLCCSRDIPIIIENNNVTKQNISVSMMIDV